MESCEVFGVLCTAYKQRNVGGNSRISVGLCIVIHVQLVYGAVRELVLTYSESRLHRICILTMVLLAKSRETTTYEYVLQCYTIT